MSLNSLIPALRSSYSKTCTTFNQQKSNPVLVFLSCGNAWIANYTRFFLVSVVMQEERQECQTQAGAESCQTPGRNLETGGHAKTNGVSLHAHTLPSRNAASRTQMLDQAEASLMQE